MGFISILDIVLGCDVVIVCFSFMVLIRVILNLCWIVFLVVIVSVLIMSCRGEVIRVELWLILGRFVIGLIDFVVICSFCMCFLINRVVILFFIIE